MERSVGWRAWRVAGLAVLLVAASAIGPLMWGRMQGAFGQAAGGAKPVVVPITPFRLVDTRPASEDPILGGPDEPLGHGETRTYQAAGVNAVPADAIGVVLNITAPVASADSFLTIYPSGSARPGASTLNPFPGRIVFNSATVLLGAGKFSVFNFAGSTHVIIDVVGYLVDHNHDERYLEQNQPIVMSEPAGSWSRWLSTTAPSTIMNLGHLIATTGDGVMMMPLTMPRAVGGTSYRLASVEWCLPANTVNSAFVTSAVLFQDQPSASGWPLAIAAQDLTDRSAAGCYTLSVPATSPRSFVLAVGLTGQTPASLPTTSVGLTGVTTTWVPATGAADVVGGEEPADPTFVLPPEMQDLFSQ